jgi:secondary thiamine-phosphate synthase enzyme
MEKIVVRTSARTEMVDITHEVRRYVSDKDVVNGLVLVYVPHTTAGVTINEGADPAVQQDIVSFLNNLIPQDSGFRHS